MTAERTAFERALLGRAVADSPWRRTAQWVELVHDFDTHDRDRWWALLTDVDRLEIAVILACQQHPDQLRTSQMKRNVDLVAGL